MTLCLAQESLFLQANVGTVRFLARFAEFLAIRSRL